MDSATKGYTDAVAAGLLPLSGGSLSGTLLPNGDPASSQQAATKHYADLKLSRSSDTLSGMLALAADPILTLHAATKNYVDVQVSGALPKSGGTLLGGIAHPPPGSIENMFIKGLRIQADSEPILSILERSAWGGIRGHVLK